MWYSHVIGVLADSQYALQNLPRDWFTNLLLVPQFSWWLRPFIQANCHGLSPCAFCHAASSSCRNRLALSTGTNACGCRRYVFAGCWLSDRCFWNAIVNASSRKSVGSCRWALQYGKLWAFWYQANISKICKSDTITCFIKFCQMGVLNSRRDMDPTPSGKLRHAVRSYTSMDSFYIFRCPHRTVGSSIPWPKKWR